MNHRYMAKETKRRPISLFRKTNPKIKVMKTIGKPIYIKLSKYLP